jgi:hypothetical protein
MRGQLYTALVAGSTGIIYFAMDQYATRAGGACRSFISLPRSLAPLILLITGVVGISPKELANVS